MFLLIAAFGATFAAMALMLSLGGRLTAETLASALLVLVLGFIAVLFSADSLRARPVGGGRGFQLFTRRHSRRWSLPLVLGCSLLVVAYLAFRPAPAPVDPALPPALTTVPPAAASSPAPVATDAREEVTAAVEAWRSAWAARDLPRYLAAYTPDFHPADLRSHAAWVSQRTDRLRNARGLRVEVEQLAVSAEGERATARFLQRYRAGSLDDQVHKRLDFVRGADGWKIREEVVEAPGQP